MTMDILVIDDETDIRMLICKLLEDEGYQTRHCSNSVSALEAISRRQPGLVILDIWLQGSPMDGIELLTIIQQNHPEVPVIMISGHGNIETAVAAIRQGAYDFIEKPFKSDHLLVVVARAIEAAKLKKENAELRSKTGLDIQLVGSSASINQLRQSIEKVAPTGSRVLITGAPGSGKERAARLIHFHSKRAKGPFVVLNCASMIPERLEIELFGRSQKYENKSAPIIGTLEKAHNGTLFLDEIADMPLETQAKLVRILQENCFYRLGGLHKVDVDVRVIASTSCDLLEKIREGNFRQDLFYRLNVVSLPVPALKERREDIPELIKHFVTHAKINGLVPKHITEDAIATLQAYDWPGNIRQLKNVVESLLIMANSEDQVINTAMLPSEISQVAPPRVQRDSGAEIMGLPLREARELFEKQYLDAQVARFGGNISRTAVFVGMERSALHRKLKILGLTSCDRSPKNDE
ncbi:MAG: sigma-54 dependent transcriptional regulator [Alphaproteobacteria bacterium]|nr:sigma-54 dependent transcriptional regulator [Alphaproteobacteria bacterium]